MTASALRAALDEIDAELTATIRRHDALLDARTALVALLGDDHQASPLPVEWAVE